MYVYSLLFGKIINLRLRHCTPFYVTRGDRESLKQGFSAWHMRGLAQQVSLSSAGQGPSNRTGKCVLPAEGAPPAPTCSRRVLSIFLEVLLG